MSTPPIEHFFGPSDGPPAQGERLCNEPNVPCAKIHRVYHTTYRILPCGNFVCTHCGEKFLEDP